MIEMIKGLFPRKASQELGTFVGSGANAITPSSYRTASSLLKAYSASPWLRAVVAHIAQRVSAVELTLHKAETENNAKRLMRKSYQDRRKEVDQLIELEAHPLIDLLYRGNPLLTGIQARMLTHIYLDLIGNALWVVERNIAGIPVEIWPAPTTWVKELPSQQNGNTWSITWQGSEVRKIPMRDVVWFRVPDPEVPYGFGTGLAQVLADELDADEYAAKMIKAAFYNRGHIDFVMTVMGAKPEELRRAKHSFDAHHRGVGKAGGSFWHTGQHKLDKITNTFDELQVTDLREFERDFIIAVFRVAPESMGLIKNSNRATITEAESLLVRNVIVPRLENELATIQRNVIDTFDSSLILSYRNPMPDDKELELSYCQAQPGTLTINEWRARQGFKPLERGGDQLVGSAATDLGSKATTKAGDTTKAAEVTKTITPTELDTVLAAIEASLMSDVVAPFWADQTLAVATATLEAVNFTGAFDLINPLVEKHIAEFSSERITLITNTTKEAVRSTLAEGMAKGESISKLADRVREEMGPDKWAYRGETIARTETGRSSNFATHAAYEVAGMERKEWIATRDSRVRDHHIALDGKVKDLNEPFEFPDGVATMYPGESGVAKQDINCRCTIAAVVDEVDSDIEAQKDRRDSIWKAFDATAKAWEDESLDLWAQGNAEQMNAALKTLESFE